MPKVKSQHKVIAKLKWSKNSTSEALYPTIENLRIACNELEAQGVPTNVRLDLTNRLFSLTPLLVAEWKVYEDDK